MSRCATFPRVDQGVGDDDGGCVGSGPPVGGEVDDRGWQLVVEQHVAAEVAVDELAGGWHGTERGGQPWQVVNLREVVGGTSPGDAVAGGPGAGPVIQEAGPGNAVQSGVEALADGNDLWPAALVVLAGQVLGGAPAIDAERAIGGSPRLG